MLSNREILTQVYIAYYNRAPDPLGFQFWIDLFDGGMSLVDIARDFATQTESFAVYPFLETPDEAGIQTFLTAVYENLFNRLPDDAGLNFWTNVILDGVMPVGDVVLEIIEGAQETDVATLANKVDVAEHWLDCASDDPNYEQSDAATAASRAALDVVTDARSTFYYGRSENEEFFGKDDVDEETPLNTAVPVVDDGTLTATEFLVNETTVGSQEFPHVATLADGNVIYAWTDANNEQTWFRIYGPDGEPVTGEVLAIDASNGFINDFSDDGALSVLSEDRFDATVTALPDGGFVISAVARVTFASPSGAFGSGSLIYGREFDANGDDESDVYVVNTDEDLANSPVIEVESFDVSANPDGNLLFVWEATDTSILGGIARDTGIPLGRVVEPDGSPESDIFSFRSPNSVLGVEVENNEPNAAALSNGNYAAVWTQEVSGVGGLNEDLMFVTILEADGDEEVREIKVISGKAGLIENPEIIALEDGGFMLSWLVREPISGAADEYTIRAQNFDEDGEAVGADFEVFDFGTTVVGDYSAIKLINGNVVMTWRTNLESLAAIVETDGTVVVPEFQLDLPIGSEIPEHNVIGELIMTPTQNGGFSVVFGGDVEIEMGDISDTGVIAKFYDENGEVFEVERVLPANSIGFLTDEELIDLGGFTFDANDAVITAVDATSTFGATLDLLAGGFIQYSVTTSPQASALDMGEQLTDTFGYTVANGSNLAETVDLVGIITYQGFDNSAGA